MNFVIMSITIIYKLVSTYLCARKKAAGDRQTVAEVVDAVRHKVKVSW